ncbi:MAG: hypothetical protein JWP75_2580 [Frondihabitans sp.]|nr:hypothetical protein [Frondihabitans sp.]
MLDWTVKTGRFSAFDVQEFVLSLPRERQRIGEWVDPRCDSFLESVVRTRLRLSGHRVKSQVPVGALGAIDLVVDDAIGVETDGFEHHSATFDADRTKDLAILTDGRTSMRLAYTLVRDEWATVEAALDTALRVHRAHRPRPATGGASYPRTLEPRGGCRGRAVARSAGMQAASGRLPFL